MTVESTVRSKVSVEGGAASAAELARLEQGLNKLDTAQKRVANSAGQMRAATANLGQQIGDIGQGLALGIAPATIFAQQAGQVGFALSGMGGALGRVGAFLSGPFGAALTVGAIGLGVLASAHARAGEASDKQGEAEKRLKQTLDALDQASGRLNRTTEESIRLGTAAAEATLKKAQANRVELQTKLELARAEVATRLRQANDPAFANEAGINIPAGLAGIAAGQATGLEADIAANRAEQATLRAQIASGAYKTALIAATAATSAAAKANLEYERTETSVRKAVEAGTLTQQQAEARLITAIKTRDAAVDASRAATKAATAETREAASAAREYAKGLEAVFTAASKATTAAAAIGAGGIGIGLKESIDKANAADRQSSGIADIVSAAEARLPAVGAKVAQEFRNGALADAAAIGQAIGGSAGRVFASIAALGFGTKGKDGVTRDLTGVGGKLTSLLQPLGDVFGSGGKKFAGLVGQAAGGAATGSVVSGIGDALGIKNSKIGASIGGAIGSFIPIPGGELIGSLLGGLLPGLLGSKPKGSTTVSASGGKIGQSSTGDKAIQKATGQLGNSISDAIQAIADQLGAGIGDFSVSIGKSGEKFRVDTTGGGSTKKNNSTVLGFGTDEGAALAAAIADALKDGAIKSSPRVQAALTAYGDNVNKAVAEALKVKGLEDLLADRKNPFATAFRTLEAQLKQRVDVASKYGFDLVEIEKVNGEDRARAVKETLQQATGSVRALLNELTFGSKATGSPSERLAGLNAERDRLSGLVRGGDTSQLDAIASVIQQIDDLQKEAFGKTAGFATGRAENVSLLNDLVKQTEDRIKAAADAARAGTDATVDKLTEANASLDDLVNGQLITNARLADLAKLYGGSGGGFSFALSGEVARV